MLSLTLPEFNDHVEIINRTGRDVKSSNSSLKSIFVDFCNVFKDILSYSYTFSNIESSEEKILETNDGDILGIHYNNLIISQGIEPNLFCVDPLGYNKTECIQLVEKFKSFLIKLYNILCKKQEIEEVPDWIKNDTCFDLIEEKQICAEIIENQNRIEELLELNSSKEREKI